VVLCSVGFCKPNPLDWVFSAPSPSPSLARRLPDDLSYRTRVFCVKRSDNLFPSPRLYRPTRPGPPVRMPFLFFRLLYATSVVTFATECVPVPLAVFVMRVVHWHTHTFSLCKDLNFRQSLSCYTATHNTCVVVPTGSHGLSDLLQFSPF